VEIPVFMAGFFDKNPLLIHVKTPTRFQYERTAVRVVYLGFPDKFPVPLSEPREERREPPSGGKIVRFGFGEGRPELSTQGGLYDN
jgi:hypothetical protein